MDACHPTVLIVKRGQIMFSKQYTQLVLFAGRGCSLPILPILVLTARVFRSGFRFKSSIITDLPECCVG